VGEAPTLRIGSLMGDTTQELDGARDAKRLRDDRVVVATSGSHDVRVFDAAGRLLAHLGREGDGPGEFRFPVKLGVVSADSVAVWDIALRRVSVFDLDDGSVREVDLRPPPAYPTTQFAVVDGDFVIGSRVNRPSRSARMVPQSLLLLRYSPSGTLVDTLETLPDGEAAWITAGAMAMFGPPLFGSHALIASGGTLLYATGGSTASVEALDSTGKVVAAVRWQSPDRRVTDADLSTYREDRLKRANAAARPQLRRWFEATPVAKTFPAIGAIVTGNGGSLWVKTYQRPGSDTETWLSFERDGRFRCRANLAPRFRAFEFGDGWVLGVRSDSLDVQYVELWGLDEG